ncbi:hypothetical protein Dsin_013010 [Dipteronia sinensis]|uniref:Reverse transcriptase zinc-binding domain-containing protein n=1 Tax=Dipteronia sinensis TaxID=43782 RepID=A0AAE0EA63_9ROSI|nr:hypothetical protein Dsin_013010 [Dipteronia sinensis]
MQVNLAKRNVPISGLCPVCLNSFETTIHVLWGFSGLKKRRSRYGLLQGFSFGRYVSFQDFFFYCTQNLGKKELELLFVILWRVWFLRNQLVHGRSCQDMDNVVSWFEVYLAKFHEANSFVVVQGVLVRPLDVKWQSPGVGVFKMNTDATISV